MAPPSIRAYRTMTLIILSIALWQQSKGAEESTNQQGAQYNSNEITVRASPLDEGTNATSSITRVTVEGQQSIIEVLQGIEGINIMSINNAPGQPSFVRMRGLPVGQTQVLIDGVPMSDPSYPQQYASINMIPIVMVESIEIIRGAQALRYGGGALGGVINIHTKKGDGELRPVGAGSIGSQKTFSADIGIEGQIESESEKSGLSFNVHRGNNSSEGIVVSETGTDPNGYQNLYSINVVQYRNRNLEITAFAQLQKSMLQVNTWDANAGKLGDDLYLNSNDVLQGYLTGTYTMPLLSTTLLYKGYKSNTDYDDPNWPSTYKGVNHTVKVVLEEKKWHTGTLSIEGQLNRMEQNTYAEPISQSSMAIALIEQGYITKTIQGQAGVRIDGVEGNTGVVPTLQVGLAKEWKVFLLRMNYGTSYRYPFL